MRVMRLCAWQVCRHLTGTPDSPEKLFPLHGDAETEVKKPTKAEIRKKEQEARKALKKMEATMNKIIAAKQENGVRS